MSLLNLEAYSLETKVRSENAGRVAILVNKKIQYTIENTPKNIEAIIIKIKLINSYLTICSYYNRPSKKNNKISLNTEFLKKLSTNNKNLLIIGDLNDRMKKYGCNNVENENGKLLRQTLSDSELTL